jgi:hypothetical protein
MAVDGGNLQRIDPMIRARLKKLSVILSIRSFNHDKAYARGKLPAAALNDST